MADRTCAVDGCNRPVIARGWCWAHYTRWREHGDVQAHRPVQRRRRRVPTISGDSYLTKAATTAAGARGETVDELVARAVRREIRDPSCRRCETARPASWSRTGLCTTCIAVRKQGAGT